MSPRTTHALAPFSGLYGAIVAARLALYRAGIFKTHRINAPVISVGNLTTGGTGKTPLVAWLARAVAREGRSPCVLTRGYGRADAHRRVVVSDGARVLAEAREGGDEPRLLAEALSGLAAVVSDADRVAAAHWAMENLRSDAFILDDGFQHLRLARDLDVVTIDATNPWGGAHLLPRGRLRERRSGLRRADCVVVTRAELAADLAVLRAEIAPLTEAVVLTAQTRTLGLRTLGGDELAHAVEQPVAAFCGVGNPQAFFAHLRADGHTLVHTRAFPDHHPYTPEELTHFVREAVRHGARTLLTTAKDGVKLRAQDFALPVYIVEVELQFDYPEALLTLVRQALSTKTPPA
ncbi:MAG TPA: tetraacyldisaccharide 4'-kinase [Pyrinomonadaceae bacterium]|nr:tetraacyldisaccharide 4'-kinase [Pyrinomonadaceae bacterium]